MKYFKHTTLNRVLFALFLICFSNPLFSQNLDWIKSLSPPTDVFSLAQKMVSDGAGNIYVGGRFTGTVDLDPGPAVYNATSYGAGRDAFLLKIDNNGNFLWARTWGNLADDEINGLVVDSSNNVYTAGDYGIFKKFAPNGDLIWSKTIPGNSPADMTLFNNSLYITGLFYFTINYNTVNGPESKTANGSSDIFVLKTDTSGQIIWLKSFGGTNEESTSSLQATSNGKIAVGGKFRSTVDFDPGVGVYNLTSGGFDEAFVIQLDTNGIFQWADGFPGTGNSVINDITADNNNNVYCVGNYTGNIDFDPTSGQDTVTSSGSDEIFYLKLNASGNVVWRQSIGGTSNDWGYQIALTSAQKLIISGVYTSDNLNFDVGNTNFTHSCNGAANVYFIGADLDGHFSNAGFIEGTSFLSMSAIYPLSAGGFLLCGDYNYCGNGCDFDPGTGTQDLTGLSGLTRSAYFGKYNDIMPLSLNLLDLNATKSYNGNLVSWLTTDEIAVLNYEIEASDNGINFDKIGTVEAYNHTGNNQYEFTDLNTTSYPHTRYYRVKMVNQDNSHKYSKIVSVIGNDQNNKIISISPNPANDFILIKGTTDNCKISIRNMCGGLMQSGITKDIETKVDVSRLLPGLYVLSIVKKEGSIINLKLSKQ
jgi:hypothetical protein